MVKPTFKEVSTRTVTQFTFIIRKVHTSVIHVCTTTPSTAGILTSGEFTTAHGLGELTHGFGQVTHGGLTGHGGGLNIQSSIILTKR